MAAPFPTKEDLFAVGARELLTRASLRPAGKRVTAAAVYTVGTNVNSALAGAAAMADEAIRHTAIRFGELYLDSAEGDALQRVITDRIAPDLVRKQPSPSLVSLTVTRVSSAQTTSAFSRAAGAIVRTSSGIEFETLADFGLAANELGTRTLDAQAVSAGSVGNVDAGTVAQFAVAPSDPGILVTNLGPAVGGSDVESNRDYLARAKMEAASRVRGVAGAIESAALRVPGIKWAILEEVLDSNGDPNGVLRLYIADINGQSNLALLEKARLAIYPHRTAGMIPSIVNVSPVWQSINYQLAFEVGTNLSAAREQLKTLTVALVNELAPGETLQRSMLYSIARQVTGAIVIDTVVSVPSADVVPGIGRKIRTTADRVTVNGV